MRLPMFGSLASDGALALMGMDEGGQKAGGIRTALDEPTKQFANLTGKGGRAAWNGVETDERAKPDLCRRRYCKLHCTCQCQSSYAQVNADIISGIAATVRRFPLIAPAPESSLSGAGSA